MAVATSVRWPPHYSSNLDEFRSTQNEQLNRYERSKALRIAEEAGYFVTVTRDLIVAKFINGSELPSYSWKRDEAVDSAITKLQVINLDGLHVRKLQDIGICIGLRILILSNNHISKFDHIVDCTQLLKLDLNNNQLSDLPGAELWKKLTKLRVLLLHGNPLSTFRSVDKLASSEGLSVLTLFDTPLSLRGQYRHHIVNTIWSLKALDDIVISDEEIIEGASFGGRFAAGKSFFKIDPCPANSQNDDEIRSTWRLLKLVDSIRSRHSPVVVIQRYVRRFLFQRRLIVRLGRELSLLSATQRSKKAVRPPPSTPAIALSVRPSTVETTGVESIKLDYDTYLKYRRPGSTSVQSETDGVRKRQSEIKLETSQIQQRRRDEHNGHNDLRFVPQSIEVDVSLLQHHLTLMQEQDDMMHLSVVNQPNSMEKKTTYSPEQITDTKRHIRKIRTAKDLFDITVEDSDDVDEDIDEDNVAGFRLKGIFPPVTDQTAVSLNEAERQCNAAAVRELKCLNHSVQPSSSSSADQSTGSAVGSGVQVERKRNVKPSKGSTVWLACLNAVANDYRHAANQEKLADKRALVRQIRESRTRGSQTATAELDRRKSWANFVEKTEHAAVSIALNQRAAFDSETLQSYRNSRRRSTALEANRRRDVEFAGDVVRQIEACARANVQFVDGEARQTRSRHALATVSQQHSNEVETRSAIGRALLERQQLLQLRTRTAQEDIKRTISSQSENRRTAVKKRVVSLKDDWHRAATASRSKTVLLLPVISSPQ